MSWHVGASVSLPTGHVNQKAGASPLVMSHAPGLGGLQDALA
jgi:hypothetical protein